MLSEGEDDDEDRKTDKRRAHIGTFVGSAYWQSPEMVENSSSGPFTDLWSLGVIVYELLTGGLPFKGKTRDEIWAKIKNREFNFPSDIDPHGKDLVEQLLQKNPLHRMGYGERGSGRDYAGLKKHPFFRGFHFDEWTRSQNKHDLPQEILKQYESSPEEHKFSDSSKESTVKTSKMPELNQNSRKDVSEFRVAQESEETLCLPSDPSSNNRLNIGSETLNHKKKKGVTFMLGSEKVDDEPMLTKDSKRKSKSDIPSQNV